VLTDAEWREAYRHLLAHLSDHGVDPSLLLEMQRAPAARVVDDVPDAELAAARRDKYLRQMVSEDLDSARTRAPTPREAFLETVSVLYSRLQELPALADRLGTLLDRMPEQLVWLPDASESDFRPEQESFTAADFALIEAEKREIEAALGLLNEVMEAS